MLQALRYDLRYAVRTLLASPGFTFIAVLTLALGIGGTTAIFTLVSGLLLKPLPFSEPSQLMLVHLKAPDRQAGPGVFVEMVWSFPKYQAFKANQHAFQDTALFTPRDWNITGSSDPERVRGELIDSRYLSVLGIAPQLGRDISRDEDQKPGVAPIVLISHGLWQRRFGGDPQIVGKTIGLSTVPHTIIGVLPAGFRGLTGEATIWVPMMTASNGGLSDLNNAWSHSYYLVARRNADVSEAQARGEVELIGDRINALFPPPDRFKGTSFGAYAIPLDDARLEPLMRRAVFVLLGAVLAVLLIGCVNLANLTLARSLTRQREVAIRVAIGATRGRIVQQLLAESATVAIAGAVAGLLVAFAAMRLASAAMPDIGVVLPRQNFLVTGISVDLINIDWRTLLFTFGIAVATTLMFGLLPAWQASQSDVMQTIKTGGMGSIGRGTRASGVRTLLMIAETALALVLLIAAGLMLRSVRNLQNTGLGFEPDHVTTAFITLPNRRYDNEHAIVFFTQLLDRLRAQPGTQAVAFGNCAPLSGGCNTTSADFPDRPMASGTGPLVDIFWASADYFQTMKIALVKGRTFIDRDRAGQPKVVVVSETAARTFWPGEDPIGKRVRLGQGGFWEGDGGEVVGVVADARYRSVEAAPRASAYVPLLQSPRGSGMIFLRSTLDTAAVTAALRTELRGLDSDLPLWNVKSMGGRFGDATWRTRLSADLLGLFAALALLLAAIGLYGVMAQAVAQRTREIGVRMALGADRGGIFRLVIGRAVLITVIGVTVGIGLSLLSMRLLEALLYRVTPNDPATIAVLAVVLIAVTLLASYIPARRATRVDPLTSLRAE